MRRSMLLPLLFFCAVQQASAIESGLSSRVKDRLESAQLGRHEITIDDYNGSITLSGFVASQSDLDRVVEAARSVPGVRHIRNALEVSAGSESGRPAPELAQEVRRRLSTDKTLGGYNVSIDARGSSITLSGQAADEKVLQRIHDIAAGTPGVTSVDMAIAVPAVDDATLSERVRSTLEKEAEINLSGIDIHSSHGTVTFSGERANQREIDRILSSALMVEGVRDIRSEMKVGPRH